MRTEADLSTAWNEKMVEDHYDDYITVDGKNRYLFDAVILHPYYEPNDNWNNIAINHYCDDYYPNTGAPDCDHYICSIPPGASLWQYGTYDERLRAPYEKILGLGSNEFGNFKQFIRNRYAQSYDQQNIELQFYLEGPSKKELWTTEWNLKDKNHAYLDDSYEQDKLTSYCNSFAHGLLIQEWFLKDIKHNSSSGYRQGFHTYSTFHNYGGGAYYAMMLHADNGDRLNHKDPLGVLDPLPAPPAGQLLWLKRTMYHTFDLLSEISINNLVYLPSNFSLYAHNSNIQPTVFIDLVNNKLYIYYSNMKDETQSYVVKLGHLDLLYPEAAIIGYGSASIFNVDAERPYSSSGRSFLYTMNTCYNDVDPLHPFDIQYITGPTANISEITGLTGGSIGVTVPANSFGYYVIPIYTAPREGVVLTDDQITIYPNPASSAFTLSCTLPEIMVNEFIVDIYDLNGIFVSSKVVAQNENVNVAELPSGIYMIAISNKQKSFSITKKLIKIN